MAIDEILYYGGFSFGQRTYGTKRRKRIFEPGQPNPKKEQPSKPEPKSK